MAHSKNWKALAIPSITGQKTTLFVSGEVGSGIIAPTLEVCDDKIKRPDNVVAFDLKHEAGGPSVTVSASEDFTNMDGKDIVIVFDKDHRIEAAIIINRNVHSFRGEGGAISGG